MRVKFLAGALGMVLGFLTVFSFGDSFVTYIPYQNVEIKKLQSTNDGIRVIASYDKTACLFQNLKVVQVIPNEKVMTAQWSLSSGVHRSNRELGYNEISIDVSTDRPYEGELVMLTTHLCTADDRNILLSSEKPLPANINIESVTKVFAVIDLEGKR